MANPPAAVEVKARPGALRAEVAAVREEWLSSLIGTPLAVLAERDGTGHAPNFARVALPKGTSAGVIVGIIPTRVAQGLLA